MILDMPQNRDFSICLSTHSLFSMYIGVKCANYEVILNAEFRGLESQPGLDGMGCEDAIYPSVS